MLVVIHYLRKPVSVFAQGSWLVGTYSSPSSLESLFLAKRVPSSARCWAAVVKAVLVCFVARWGWGFFE